MNYYYITGTSSGIGKAFAEELLKDDSNKVIGISRQKTIEHANYRHFHIDLTDLASVVDFKFELHADAKKLYLINNAGALGFIKPVGKLSPETIISSYTLNLISPSLLTNAFMACYETADCEKVVLMISSGAGKIPIDGWAVYCASKAGIDMFSKTINAEQELKSKHPQDSVHKGFKVFSIAPGVVNTNMQTHIRSASVADFSRLADFVGYKTNLQLVEPEFVSKKFISILANVKNIKEVLSSLKDYE